MKQIYLAIFIAFIVYGANAQKSVDYLSKDKIKQSTQSYLVNGLKYNILSTLEKTVELTYLGDSVGDPLKKYVGNIVIPDRIIIGNDIFTVKVIGNQAFDYCRNLTSVTFPNTIDSIKYAAFYWCDKLTTISLPSSIKYIGFAAFEKCSGLTTLNIPENVTKIDEYAFINNTNLQSVNLPASVSQIGKGAFSFCNKLTTINVASGNMNFSVVDGVLFNKDKTTIVSYPNSKSPTYTVPQTVVSIGDWAFAGCDQLTSIILPQSLKSIGIDSYYWCSSLSTINFPNSLQSIGDWAFQECKSLSGVYLPESLNYIGKYAFSICPDLGAINWPASVPVINEGMFWRSTKLLTFDVPATVTKIDRFVFTKTNSLSMITVNPNNQIYSSQDGVLFNKNKTTLIAFPYSKSDSYIVPQTVDSIGSDGFRYCKNLTSITLPANIRSIANVAFDSCVSLKKITIERSVPPTVYMNTFRGVNKQTCVLKVPSGFIAPYQTAQYWSEFKQITDVANTATPDVNNSNIKIYTNQNSIIIEGTQINEMVQVFSTSGKMLYNIQSTGEKIAIPVNQGQIYFIKTKEGGKKIMI